ncbi:ABC transporter permease [Ignavigranum ruoffiae]|uniref:ABC transporter permease n=1 Tax=Ignavigranum ruoffiae TaxID=89093 RepID=UPI0020457925|nr:ABC transporter permease [Ignavigranum ruoffiae]UPQ85088.1 ABC transporter permease [Ignavigranum ruoffiae]
MKLFKLFFRLARKYKKYYLITIILLLVVTLPLKGNSAFQNDQEFQSVDFKMTIFNQDQGSISRHLVNYLASKAEIVELEDDAEVKADALYNFDTYYILTIPEHWSETILTDKTIPPLAKQPTADSEAEIYIDNIIFTYLKSLEAEMINFNQNSDDKTIQRSLDQMQADLQPHIQPHVIRQENQQNNVRNFGLIYCSMIGFVTMMTFIKVIGGVQRSTQNPEIKKRDHLSKMTEFSRTSQLWFASLTWAFTYWLMLMMLGLIIFGFEPLVQTQGQLYMLNALLAIFGIHGLAYLLSTLAQNKGVIDFLSIGLSLLLSFFSGVFVPLQIIDPTMKKLASLATPIWQVQTNEMIANLSSFDWAHSQAIWRNFGIQVLIILAYFAISYMIQRHRFMNKVN